MLLRKQNNIKFNFIGNGSEAYSGVYQTEDCSIEICGNGWVTSLGEKLLLNRIVIVPILSGAGVQNKIIDGLQLGIPTLVSKFSADALPDNLARLLLICDSVTDFADQIADINKNSKIIDHTKNIEKFKIAQAECERDFLGSIR